jgi:hypothetical protein
MGRKFPVEEKKVSDEAKYILWLNQHERELKRYYGKWITFNPDEGIISVANSPTEAREKFLTKYPHGIPHVYHIPRKDEGMYVL